ncbi:hypothetical protein MPY17_10330 [Rhodococcus opacus]|uniref:hypothetical protein n=1 Tax=Rhodococcus opacus TaxID=37919 RepID=UPI001FF6E78A|nr:hypothetical protein [Rhodococcus opacus]UOT06105.1 hypothetical protein MPY17_10330 [Rhodococcus opacus]
MNRGNPTGAPARSPRRDRDHASRPRASASNPLLYASFEFSPHHGATTCLRLFQHFRSAAKLHPSAGVSSVSATP